MGQERSVIRWHAITSASCLPLPGLLPPAALRQHVASPSNFFCPSPLGIQAALAQQREQLLDGSCTHITAAAVQAIASSCPNLTTVNLNECTNITDAAVQALAGSCPKLTTINLEDCTNITDAAKQALRASHEGLTIY